MQVVSVKTTKRTETGKKANKAVRKSGAIPAVLYGGNETHLFTTTMKDVKKIVYTPEFKIAELDIEGTSHKAILKDIQFHPVTDNIEHIDFLKLIDGVNIKVNVPIKYEGSSPGVKEGGKLVPALRTVQIKTTPDKLVDSLVADISEIMLGQTLRVKDLEVDESIQVMTGPNNPVASVIVPRVLKGMDIEDEAAEGEAVEGAEGAATPGAEGAAEGGDAAAAPKE